MSNHHREGAEAAGPRTVIAVYKPKPGMEAALESLLARPTPALRQQGLITDRPPLWLRAADGTVLELFEWKSEGASAQAHVNPVVGALWEEFMRCADFAPLASLPEASQPFSHYAAFTPGA